MASSCWPRRRPQPGRSPRYTLAKFTDYLEYADHTSRWRHALVVVISPLPSLATSLVAPFVPLQDPQLGVRANAGFFGSFFLNFVVVVVGSVLQVHASSGLTWEDISRQDVVLIALVNSALTTLIIAAASALWRFPVPFTFVSLFVPVLLAFVVAHVVVLRGRLWRQDSRVRRALVAFLPTFVIGAFQVVAYTSLAAAFSTSSERGQLAFVLLLPPVKYAFRLVIRYTARHRPEDANESAVSSVEICAAMYQSVLMQSTSSGYATALLMAIDVVQSAVGVFVYMAKASSVPPQEIVGLAARLVRAEDAPTPTETRPPTVVSPSTKRVHPVVHASHKRPPVVHHALELLHTAESLVLIEYFEVALPLVNAAFLCVASRLPSAEYSPKLRLYHHRPVQLERALGNLLLYTSLQALSLVAMHAVVWWRYRISTTTLLAYLMERHVWALQGKLIAWLALMFQLPVLHYGFDFTFRFSPALPPLE